MTNQCYWIHVFFSSTAYQIYKKKCGRRPADADFEDPSLEAGDGESAKKKGQAVENSAFEFDDNGEEKDRDIRKITQLWNYTLANHRLWTMRKNIQGHGTTEDISHNSTLWTHTALCRPEVCTTGPVQINFGKRFARTGVP